MLSSRHQQRRRAGEGLLQVVLSQDVAQQLIYRHRAAAVLAGLAQALAQQGIGNAGALLLVGGLSCCGGGAR